MSSRERADRLLVARGLFESRARAQAAIAAGLVTADGVTVRKASEEIETGQFKVDLDDDDLNLIASTRSCQSPSTMKPVQIVLVSLLGVCVHLDGLGGLNVVAAQAQGSLRSKPVRRARWSAVPFSD